MSRVSELIPAAVLLLALGVATPVSAQKPTRETVIAHIEKCKVEKKRVDLVAAFGTDFSGLDLSGVDFRGDYRVNNETFIRGADLSDCNLKGARFGSAILDGSDFTGANLSGASFITGSLKNAVLARVSLDGTRFYQSDLSGAHLAGANLSSADITGSSFAGCDLSNAVLSGAREEYAGLDFHRATLTGADLAGLDLTRARFQSAVLRSADFTGAKLVHADFTGADLTGVSLDHCDVESAVFDGVQGLGDEEKSELEKRAQRWKLEFRLATNWFLKAAYFPTYTLVVLLLFGLTLVVLLSRPGWPVMVDAFVNAAVLIPPCILYRLFAAGGSPTAQLNAGDPSAMETWSNWVQLFPVLMVGVLVCLAVSAVVAAVVVVLSLRKGRLKSEILPLSYVALTVAHCLFAAHWVGINYPDA